MINIDTKDKTMCLTSEERKDVLEVVKHFQMHHISPSTDRFKYFTHLLEKIENDDENISGYGGTEND